MPEGPDPNSMVTFATLQRIIKRTVQGNQFKKKKKIVLKSSCLEASRAFSLTVFTICIFCTRIEPQPSSFLFFKLSSVNLAFTN